MAKASLPQLLILSLLLVFFSSEIDTTLGMNMIDKCWRTDTDWRSNRQRLAECSVGFVGKMTNNAGKDVMEYIVIDPSDDPVKPRPGTLRYGSTIEGKVWIKFEKDMQIELKMPLLVSSFTVIDGRGANVHISKGCCLYIHEVTDVIIHGLSIHHCRSASLGNVAGPGGKIIRMGKSDPDAITIRSSSKIWIDHNNLYECEDGLIDVTRGSTGVTLSNNWLKNQNKVMLLGHIDGFEFDRNMKVTVAFNHFGPNCIQRMPRVRSGYAHVVNNNYEQWGLYAIGGSSHPSILSEGNVFRAPTDEHKSIIWRSDEDLESWNWKSIKDRFVNGAYFPTNDNNRVEPGYTPEQDFDAEESSQVNSLTEFAGVLEADALDFMA